MFLTMRNKTCLLKNLTCCMIKISQPMRCITVPAIAIASTLDIVTTESAIMIATTGITWCSTLYLVGFLGTNRIGFVYLKNDYKNVKIAYTDFWGKRVDIDVDVDDIWPLNDLPVSPLNYLYHSVRRYSTKETLKFNIQYGKIVDPEKFQIVFGNPSSIENARFKNR